LLKFHTVWNATVPPWDLKTRLEPELDLLAAVDMGQRPGPKGRSILLPFRGLKPPAPSAVLPSFGGTTKGLSILLSFRGLKPPAPSAALPGFGGMTGVVPFQKPLSLARLHCLSSHICLSRPHSLSRLHLCNQFQPFRSNRLADTLPHRMDAARALLFRLVQNQRVI
jgi:hypothetical protein